MVVFFFFSAPKSRIRMVQRKAFSFLKRSLFCVEENTFAHFEGPFVIPKCKSASTSIGTLTEQL